MRTQFVGLTFLLLVLPGYVSASVLINEVAWMGSAGDANAEWIELYNSGSESASLEGWILRAADGQPTITLAGSIGANGYLLLKRGEGKDYTGALGNDGEILELLDQGGAIVDSVDGSDAWNIGGSNETKDTLSRFGNGFGTAVPTPGKTNSSTQTPHAEQQESADELDESDSSNTESDTVSKEKSTGKSESSDDDDDNDYLAPKIDFTPRLSATAGGDRTVTVGTASSFSAHAYENDGDEVLNARFEWNFGDGTISQGREVGHSYAYPGDYVAVLTVTREEFRERVTVTDRIVISARAAEVVVTDATSEFIRVENTEAHELDLSGWILVSGDAQFSIPEGTVLLPDAAIQFPRSATGLWVNSPYEVALYYPDRTRASAYVEYMQEVQTDTAQASSTPEEAALSVPVSDTEPIATPETVEEPHPLATATPDALVASAGAAGILEKNTSDESGSFSLWLLSLLGIMGVGGASVVMLGRKSQVEPAMAEAEIDHTTFNIIEDEDDFDNEFDTPLR